MKAGIGVRLPSFSPDYQLNPAPAPMLLSPSLNAAPIDRLARPLLLITRWLWTYNHERPNMALGGITPMQKLALAA